MIILSCSLPKSASTIFATYIEDLISTCNNRSGQNALQSVFARRYFDRIDPNIAIQLLEINLFHGTTVIKSHCAPHRLVRWLILTKQAKALYISRDPRDVVLSAMDSRKNRGGAAFSDFTDLSSGANRVIGWAKVWREWTRFGNVGFFRYEDLMTSLRQVLHNVCDYLGLRVSDSSLTEILDRHERNKQQSLNFNKGTVGRHLHECNVREQALLNARLGDLAREMGYE